MNEGIEVLTNMFKDKEWFHSVGLDQYGRYVVYIHNSTHETLYDIPGDVGGKQVLVHFAGSLLASRNEFVNDLTVRQSTKKEEVAPQQSYPDLEELDGNLLKVDLDDLQRELTRLEKSVGSHCLQDIFYEIHDGPNAVTDNSARYPEARLAMEALYQAYGFDVIYEELDG